MYPLISDGPSHRNRTREHYKRGYPKQEQQKAVHFMLKVYPLFQ